MLGVSIDGTHSYNDLGLIMGSKLISFPTPKTNYVSIPMRDGAIDFTESLTGKVKYDDREIQIVLYTKRPFEEWADEMSKLGGLFHGKNVRLVFDDEPSWYYETRLELDGIQYHKGFGQIKIKGTTTPFKFDLFSPTEDWLWDSFDFETGIINELKNIIVSGSKSIDVIGRVKNTTPIIEASQSMKVEFEGTSYDLSVGENTIYGIILKEGNNTLTFTGNGTVNVDFKGGIL